MQSSKGRFILQNADPQNHNFYKYELIVCFVQSIRTKQVRAIVYDDITQSVLPQLSQLIEDDGDLKQTLFSKMLQAASESEDLTIYNDLDLAKSDPLVKEDVANIITAEKKLIEQEDKQSIANEENKRQRRLILMTFQKGFINVHYMILLHLNPNCIISSKLTNLMKFGYPVHG